MPSRERQFLKKKAAREGTSVKVAKNDNRRAMQARGQSGGGHQVRPGNAGASAAAR